MSNQSENAAAIDKYRAELRSMLDDISGIDKTILTRSVDAGLRNVKQNTPVGKYPAGSGKVGGTLRKGWQSPPIHQDGNGVEKSLDNAVEYAPYVNDGHRIVSKTGETVGYVPGQHFLEHANNVVERAMAQEFNSEIERVKREHGG